MKRSKGKKREKLMKCEVKKRDTWYCQCCAENNPRGCKA